MFYYYQNRPHLFSPDSPIIQEKSFDPNWDAEIKKNGTRLKLQKIDNKFLFYNRHKELLKYQPSKELLDELNSLELPNETDLDGELMHTKTKHIKHFIFFYDIYFLGGKKMIGTLEERRDILKNIFQEKVYNHIKQMEQFQTDFLKIFNEVIKEEENEGLVIKCKQGKIVWNLSKSPDVDWQIKIRKPNKNYKF